MRPDLTACSNSGRTPRFSSSVHSKQRWPASTSSPGGQAAPMDARSIAGLAGQSPVPGAQQAAPVGWRASMT